MAKLPSGTFEIVQKECSFTRIGCIVAEIKSFMHLHLTPTSYFYRGGRFGVWESNVYILVHMGPSNVIDHTFLDMYG